MFSLRVEDGKTFQTFLNQIDVEYADIYLKGENVMIVLNDNEVLLCYELEAARSINQPDTVMKVPRMLLQKFATNNCTITVNTVAHTTTISFKTNGKESCFAKFAEQVIFIEGYKERLHIFEEIDEKYYFDISSLEHLYKIGKTASSLITVDSGYACVLLSGNARIYKEFSYPYSFTISASSLQILHSCCNTVYDLQNYLCAVGNGYRVVVQKSRSSSNSEFKYVKESPEEFKKSFSGYLDFYNVSNFIVKMHPKVSMMELDLRKQMCLLEIGNIQYNLPIFMREVRKSDKSNFNKLVLPVALIKEVLLQLPVKELFVGKTRNFVMMEYKDYTILF